MARIDAEDIPSDFEQATGIDVQEDLLTDDNNIRYIKILSTLITAGGLFVWALITQALETWVELHLWVLTTLGNAYGDTIGAVFEGGRFTLEQSWAGAASNAELLDVLAPWVLLADVLFVLGLIFAFRRWGPL